MKPIIIRINRITKILIKQLKIRSLVLNKKTWISNNLESNNLDNKPILRLIISKSLAFKEISNPNSKL